MKKCRATPRLACSAAISRASRATCSTPSSTSRSTASPHRACSLGKLVYGLVRALYEHTIEQLDEPEALAVAATGGYGRGTLAPFSDIDLLFLTPAAPDPHTLQVVEYMLYFLWDLGLKVGHATRSIAECLTEGARDATIRTALLDSRIVAGGTELFSAPSTPASAPIACKEAGAAGYIAAKQAEREVRHRRYGDSPYVVEPNVKEGLAAADCATSRHVLDQRPLRLRHRNDGPACRGRRHPLAVRGQARPPLLGIPSGPCASTCTTSLAAPRNA